MSKKRSIQGKSNHGAILRQPCRYYLKGTCTRSPCEYWHPPECQLYKTETGCKKPVISVCSRIIRFPQKKRKRRQECSGYCQKCTTIGLHLGRLGCVGFPKRQTVPRKPDATSLGIDSKSTVHSVYAVPSKCLGKERTIAWKNTSSPCAMKFEDRSHEETERQQRCPKLGMESCQTYLQAQREEQSYMLFAYRKVDYAGRIHHETEGKRVCGGFRSSYAYGQQARL